MTPLTALLTGLTIGGLTCLAIQGGLLFGLLARRQEGEETLTGWRRLVAPVSAFLVAKLVIYTLLGFSLGWLGDKIQLSTTVRLWLQTFAGVFMVVAGIRLIFPHWLPWLQLNPPASVRRLIRQHSKSQALVAPATLGLLTVLLPCGTTQAMELAAIAIGSPWQGAAILLAFTLGTAPLFLVVGVLAKGTEVLQVRLRYAAAALVVGLGLYTLNTVLVLIDSPYAAQRQIAAFQRVFLGAGVEANAASAPAAASQTITVFPTSYRPNVIAVPAAQPVQLALLTNGNYGCTSIFRIPKLRIEQILPPTGTTTIVATFPSPGQYIFSCGMGMFRGTINAV